MNDHSEQAIDLLESKTLAITNRLDRNWMYQFLLATLGLAFLLSPSVAAELAALTPLKNIPPRFCSMAIPALLVYTFINFGYLLNHFLNMRRIYDKKASAHFKGLFTPDEIQDVFEKQTLFEPLYYLLKRKMTRAEVLPFLAFMIMGSFIIVFNHVVSFKMVASFTHGTVRWIILAIMAGLLSGCYVQFYCVQRSRVMKIATGVLYALSVAVIMSVINVDLHAATTPDKIFERSAELSPLADI